MKTTTVQRIFPHSKATLVHQNGISLSVPSNGVEVILHIRENECHPCAAEVISEGHYAQIGLSFEGKELVDYDGVFWLPREIGEVLTDAGFIVGDDCFG